MVSLKLFIYLSIGTLAMLIPILVQSKWYNMKVYKAVLLTVLLTVAGTVGTYILFYIENGWIGGTSFYGAVFFVPVAFLLLPKLLKVTYGTIMDLCAPAECIMLVIMKIQCIISGCCAGRVLYVTELGNEVIFPSQIAELINALVILVILMILARKTSTRGMLYPLYFIIYGGTRFVLNFFRANQTHFFLGMAPGTLWSICSIIAGGAWLMFIFVRKKQRNGTIKRTV